MVKISSTLAADEIVTLTGHCFALMEGSPHPIAMVTGPLHTLSSVNPAFCHLLNCAESEFIGKRVAEMIPGGEECVAALERVYLSGKSVVYTLRNYPSSKLGGCLFSLWPIGPKENVVGIMIQIAEVSRQERQTLELNSALLVSSVRQHELTEAAAKLTEQLQAEVAERNRLMEALRKSEEGFRLIVASVKDYSILMLDLEGNVASWNEGAERFKGYKAEEIIGKHFSIFYPQTERDSGQPEEQLKIAAAVGRFEEEGWRVRRDGSRYWASVIISALRNDLGALLGFSKITRDITVRKKTEDALRDAHALLANRARQLEDAVVLRTAELMASNEQLEAFVYSIAHDLRAPLRAMQGFSSLLVEEAGPSLSEICQGYANRINKSAQFMDSLLMGLLAFSRISQEEVQLVPVNLETVVDFMLSRLEKDIQDSKSIIDNIGPWPTVLAHETTVAQVLFNLTSNAMKFVAPGASPQIRLRTEERADFVRIWVEDQGLGIAPENQEQIFRLFNRLAGEQYPGSGIGLAIVQKGVQRMGGRVGVQSVEGKGSRFWFELRKPAPLAAEPFRFASPSDKHSI